MKWLRRAVRWLLNRCPDRGYIGGHAPMIVMQARPPAMFLRCVHCLRRTSGWELSDTEPRYVQSVQQGWSRQRELRVIHVVDLSDVISLAQPQVITEDQAAQFLAMLALDPDDPVH